MYQRLGLIGLEGKSIMLLGHKLKFRVFRTTGLRQKKPIPCDLIISRENKFFFIHIPKTAGKSLRFSLFGHANGARHCTAYQLKREYPDLWENSFSFCFVRNPYGRLYSAFRYLQSGGNQMVKDKRFQKRVLADYPDFEQFVLGWLSSDRAYSNIHFIPQYEFIYYQGERLVDFIGKFEKISEDYDFLCKRLRLMSDLSHLNRSPGKVSVGLADVYSTEMAKKVREVYQRDFELFGYDFAL